jgi:surfeit locus 1 family protein
MMFRPYPVLTAVALPILAALIWLGVWQVQRAQWKAGLIADYQRTASAEPVSIETAICKPDDDGASAEGQVVADHGASGPSLRMFGHNAAGAAGWRLFQAAPGCPFTSPVLIETGFEALAIGGEIGGVPAAAGPPPTRFMVAQWPARSLLSADNIPDANEWHWFDPTPIANALGLDGIDTRYILVAQTGMPDYLTRTPPSGHIGYAATWFGMAIGFVLIYAAFHARAGRLRFGKPRQDPP